ncbi:MAG TPA: DUF2142 domain-containing protein [Pyrinomonadaceae bacterium]|nr:DUF2142 domain-containing protein [Pyrinomonadaceae bacterium]
MTGEERKSIFSAVKRRWAECVLAAIVLSSSVLSVVWVFRVPLLQNPDESSHIDYAFSIYSAGRLLNVRTPPSEWNVHPRFGGREDYEGPESTPYDWLSHQYTLYLIDAAEFHRIRFHYEQKVPADYGSLAYFQRLDVGAPQSPAQLPDLRPQDNPWMITAYPFLYYAVVAVCQKVLGLFGSGPAFLFVGARLLSVVLLAASLILTYKILLELRVRTWRALMLSAILAFFPLTTFVSSSVQPDNLTMFLVLLCSYCALLFRRRESNQFRLSVVLGFALGALLVTKYHIFLFTALAVFATVITEHIFQRRPLRALMRQLPLLLLPSILLFSIQLWVVWGGDQITGGNLRSASVSLPAGIKSALMDYYRGGPAWVSWWGTFGWMDAPLVIWSPDFQTRVHRLLAWLTLLTLLMVFFRLVQVSVRLIRLAWRKRWRQSLRIACSNPLLTSYFLFSIFMVLLYALSGNSFFAQGRHWFPYTLSGFVMALHYAPRVLPRLRVRRVVSNLLIAGLLVYCAVGAYYSLKTITDRYYPAAITSNGTP